MLRGYKQGTNNICLTLRYVEEAKNTDCGSERRGCLPLLHCTVVSMNGGKFFHFAAVPFLHWNGSQYPQHKGFQNKERMANPHVFIQITLPSVKDKSGT